jgi:hypothetical protein
VQAGRLWYVVILVRFKEEHQMPISNEFLALLLVLFVAVEVAVVWLLWQAALTVPKPFRMRWPWTLWLLLLPIISTILAFFILLPLAKSYHRYFSHEKWLGRGCYGTVVATGILTWLSLMEYVPRPGPATIKRWSHLPALVHQAHIAGSWTAAGAGIGWLAMVIIMLDLRKRAQRIQQRANAPSSANQALAWLENNASQPQAKAPDDTASPSES